mgnify:FL=1
MGIPGRYGIATNKDAVEEQKLKEAIRALLSTPPRKKKKKLKRKK